MEIGLHDVDLFITAAQKPENMPPATSEPTNTKDSQLLCIRPNTSAKEYVSAYLNPSVETSQDSDDHDLPGLDPPSYYVGLVNQAMTCYLNSLLQALYMTPEFRNALYNWEFDGQNETRSIPFQLQKLFLNLQVCLIVTNLFLDKLQTIY